MQNRKVMLRHKTKVSRALRRLGYVAALSALVVGLGLGRANAQDVKTYTRATFDEWFQKYKDAKPDFKPGDVLTVKDMERMRPFVPPGYLEQLNFPEFQAKIIPAADHRPRKDYVECSEKYQNQTKLNPDGSMANYVCGEPFPNSDLKVGIRCRGSRQHGISSSAGRIMASSACRRPPGTVSVAPIRFLLGSRLRLTGWRVCWALNGRRPAPTR